MISVKIDVTKIKKEHLFAGKNGAKYLDIILFDKPSEFGDGYVKQSIPKDKRTDNDPIIGNWKHFGEQPPAQVAQKSTGGKTEAAPDDDIPF